MDAMKSTMNNMMSALNMGSKKQEGEVLQPPSENEYKELREKYKEARQEHVFNYWDDLKPEEKGALFEQLQGFSPEHNNKISDKAINPPKHESEDEKPKLEQLPDSATTSTIDSKQEDLDQWYKDGLKLISENKVAVVLMAGGQGTRLGSSLPKGQYNIGLPSEKSLFQLQAERIVRLQHLAAKHHGKEVLDVVIAWYIMTSGPTRKPTESFFVEKKYFGLSHKNVTIFEQGVLPCINMEGKILLEEKSRVAVAPDGNGGLYNALINSGVVQDMEKRGVQHIHMFGVDNCLVRVADPTFIGFSASKKVDIATKVVRKRDAKESVGLILQKNGKPDVVEYSEMDDATAEAKDPKDSELLKFRAANIVNHYYSFGFLQSIPDWVHRLPHHVAKKKIPAIPFDSKDGRQVKPEKPNGIKLEQFVFDCFPFVSMDRFACMEVKREDEFSALKNAPGSKDDSPETSKKDIMAQGARFLKGAGATVTSEKEDEGVEVSPLISYAGEGLEYLKGREIRAPAVIEKQE
ncbi:UDP-N-acetylglucosamine pyrophosphorylase [Recurvomyces mirabilis]|uniref:UDP-N-acetylglucosamine diphosphorylase n=1 Tax=Recurvomyces mirabilis TaxID=574656 RepID=A0AAE0WJC1_9PEZI|nr:UDP-N-acetylglucosamine pyrophosphorylase [Recurvomyces mirabilis]KAK5155055.1 UDP-N-acetylglucosamine pyrophosphorylase [Recurvomyces mirabilis]